MLGLCSGRTFALLTAGPFDVLLQSLPIVVFSHLNCSRLPPPLPLFPYLPSAFLGLLCPSHGEFIHTLAHTHTWVFKITAGEAILLRCCLSNKTHFSFNFLTLQLYQPHTFSGTRGGFLRLQKHVLKAFQYFHCRQLQFTMLLFSNLILTMFLLLNFGVIIGVTPLILKCIPNGRCFCCYIWYIVAAEVMS